jgi:RimJ/RimL family protein N-acetyltransferase
MAAMVYGSSMAPRSWFPEVLTGSQVVLRRHTTENLGAFRRWYSDPEIAKLARYQEAPMRADEIERFFTARVVGPDALAMAIHERGTDRLVGTCAFSQLDGENGSALYHITIGEKDAWGHGYGTEATRLMLEHAFGTLGLHRVALFVFEFNERAIRTYRRCGFVIEGRSRESIYRDGRWWDELAMSVLESDWQGLRTVEREDAAERAELQAEAGAAQAEPGREAVGATRHVARSGLIRRTVRRFT